MTEAAATVAPKYFTVSLAELKLSPLNVRKSQATKEEDAELEAGIRARGVLFPLGVRREGDHWGVVRGGRRLAQLNKIHKGKESDVNVNVVEFNETDADAIESSLIENIQRADMHPVEEYEAFALLAETSGMTPKAIAKRFGKKEAFIDQRLALGGLHSAIRDAWKNGKLGYEPEKTAAVFTMVSDQERQKKVFDECSKTHNLGAWQVRARLIPNETESVKLLKFVGVDEYTKAGGTLINDLFADRPEGKSVPANPELLSKLADEKFDKKKQALIDEGWSWVEFATALPTTWHMWNWGDKKSDKKKTGVIIDTHHDGTLDIRYGVLKPTDKRKADTKKKLAKSKDGKPQHALSQNMANDLSRHLTGAIAATIMGNAKLAFDVLLTQMAIGVLHSTDSPFCINVENKLSVKDPTTGLKIDGAVKVHAELKDWSKKIPSDFGRAFPVIEKLSAHHKHSLMAAVVAATTDATLFTAQREGYGKDCDAVLEIVKPPVGLYWQADRKSFFDHVPKGFAEQAVKECAPNSPEATRIGTLKKDDAAALAERVVKGKAWLPEGLRHSKYPGPGADKSKSKQK